MKNMQERGVDTSVLMVPTLILAVSLCAVASGKNDATLPIAAQSSISAVVGRDATDYQLRMAPQIVQLAQLNSSGETGEDEFGQSAAISGNTIVVGAPNVTINGKNNCGAAYVFVESASGWGEVTQTAVLTASNGLTEAGFGSSVAIEGNTIVVGSPGQGTVYVFVRSDTGWTNMTETAQLTASDVTSDLGQSVQISGNTVVAGAPLKGIGGAVYVFVKPSTGWSSRTQTAELTASDVAAGDFLGNGVGISGPVIAAGAPGFGNKEPTGAGYVFVRPVNGWSDMTETAKLTASNGGGTDYFGTSVAVGKDIVVIGAIEASVGNYKDVGAAYVFVKPADGWLSATQTAELTPLLAGSEFGQSVAISGNVVVVTDMGAAFVFVKPVPGWRNTSKYAEVLAPSGTIGNFGFSVGISGNTVVASGPGNSAFPLGAALVFGP